jgi:CPA1 family monovalent cation:H+ antiporter
VAADRLEASGVLAVLATGFYLGHFAADPDDAEGRLQSRSFWEVVELLVTGFAFGLIGLELTQVLPELRHHLLHPLIDAGIVCVVVIGVRIGWMLFAGLLSHTRQRIRTYAGAEPSGVRSWRESAVLAWSGMRGVVTVATALALPLDFPQRANILLIGFAVILVTLVLQGLTLPTLVRVLGVQASSERQRKAELTITGAAAEAALARLQELTDSGDVPPELYDRLQSWYQAVLNRMRSGEDRDDDPELARRLAMRHELVGLEAELLSAARRAVLAARQQGADPEAADHVLRRLDLRAIQRG